MRLAPGTVCIIVGRPTPRRYVGRTCTVCSDEEPMRGRAAGAVGYLCELAGEDELRLVDRRLLRPLAPPGDPDVATTPARMPAEIIR